ncbi:polysaccharide lyase 8 family protein [Jiangella asiatica]|uniref:Hyaluronate lyase n=1 Tax=Jiangella asiatica TaxID=2530372 RepID=A0A4R5CW81_9ACTN|nr:polysaccharide lyase 8 family protein [Jiangella asiatica]TDE02784.1 hypothetical protein E1269_21025 [Jiangella asiatica]
MSAYGTDHGISRRHLLYGLGGAAGLAALGSSDPFALPSNTAWAAPDGTGDNFDQMRATWRDILTGGDFDPADPDILAVVSNGDDVVASLLDLVDRSENRDRVFVDAPLVEEETAEAANRVARTFDRLHSMAIAYRTPGSRFVNDDGVLADVLAGLEIANQRVYNEGQEEFGSYWSSWYNWEIAVPRTLTGICTLVYDDLPADALARYLAAIDHFVPDPRFIYPPDDPVRRRLSTGANRVDLSLNIAVRGVLGRSNERIQDSRAAIADVFRYSVEGDGFYRDGSFIQHESVAYTGGYGIALLGGFARMLALVAASPWEITGPEAEFVFGTVERSFSPVIYDNQMMDLIRGRFVSRWNERDHHRARATIEQVLRLAQAADQPTAARWRATCKGWLERDTYENILTAAPVTRVALFKELLADSTVHAEPEPVNHTIFANMDRAVHRRPGWAYAIAMCSKRISYYEELTNSENWRGFHTGDGMTYLYTSDNSQFADEFWPTVDPYRLPGITVDTTRLPDGAGDGERPLPARATWVGGATDGEFAAVGMELEPLLSSLRAKKSWFCLDEYVVALGAGISADTQVETVVENRNLHASGGNTLLVEGTAQPVTPGWNAQFHNPAWAHLEGVGGYVFPAGGSLNVVREERTGAWRDINIRGPEDPITRHYATMWFDHGTAPVDESYAYLLVPGATPTRTAELAADPGRVQILVNTDRVQAVRVPRLGVTAVNFWTAGSVDGITVDAPCSLTIRHGRGPRLSVAVADPTHEQASLSVTLDRAGYRSWTEDATISVKELHPHVAFTVDTEDADGRTHTVTFHHRR